MGLGKKKKGNRHFGLAGLWEYFTKWGPCVTLKNPQQRKECFLLILFLFVCYCANWNDRITILITGVILNNTISQIHCIYIYK